MILLSPAKTLLASPYTIKPTRPCFGEEAIALNNALKKLGKENIQTSMKLSAALSASVWEMVTHFETTSTWPALYFYSGEVMKHLSLTTMENRVVKRAMHEIYFLSGMYGVLKASDAFAPYRLEMQYSNLKLYAFWKDKITAHLLHVITKERHELVVDLLSSEYRRAVDFSTLEAHTNVITIDFLTDGKSVSMHSKKARGLMARALLQLPQLTKQSIQACVVEAYQFNPQLSSNSLYIFEKKR